MKILIASGAGGGTAGGRIGKYFHLKEFSKALEKLILYHQGHGGDFILGEDTIQFYLQLYRLQHQTQ